MGYKAAYGNDIQCAFGEGWREESGFGACVGAVEGDGFEVGGESAAVRGGVVG